MLVCLKPNLKPWHDAELRGFHAKAALCLKEHLPISDLGLGTSKFRELAFSKRELGTPVINSASRFVVLDHLRANHRKPSDLKHENS